MTTTYNIEVIPADGSPSYTVILNAPIHPIGYRYSRRSNSFIVVWSPQSRRKQEIEVMPRAFVKVLPELKAGILAGYTAGSVDVAESQLRELGFYVSYRPEVPQNATVV